VADDDNMADFKTSVTQKTNVLRAALKQAHKDIKPLNDEIKKLKSTKQSGSEQKKAKAELLKKLDLSFKPAFKAEADFERFVRTQEVPAKANSIELKGTVKWLKQHLQDLLTSELPADGPLKFGLDFSFKKKGDGTVIDPLLSFKVKLD
jgi:selenocysteine-specific translation elongation factor